MAESKLSDGGISNTGTSNEQSARDNAKGIIKTFTNPQGKVYGFVTENGEMYLDEDVISPEHPMHEYTHLWDGTIKEADPRLWARGKKLMQTEAPDQWKRDYRKRKLR